MIVVCEQCRTRFRLAKTKLPPQGAKVRCSRCQHTFHVKPEPPARDKHSIVRRVVEDTAPVSSDEDPDLENPEFLDGGPAPLERDAGAGQAIGSASEEAVLGLDAETESELEEPVLGFDDAKQPVPQRDEPPPPPPVIETSLEPPPAELDLTQPPKEIGPRVDLGSDLEAFRLEGPIEERGPGGAVSQSVGPPHETQPFSPFEPGVFDPEASPVGEESDAPLEKARRWTAPRPRLGSALSSGIAGLLRLLAYGVGLALAVAAGRAALVFSISAAPEPVTLRGAGWVASNFETFHAHGLAGDRLLVVRGQLGRGQGSSAPETRAAPPRISGRLLDGQGNLLGEEVRARPGRLDDAALAPDQVPALLAELEPSLRRPGSARRQRGAARDPSAFTLLFQDPPPEAVRIQINMRSPTDLRGGS